MSVTKTTWLQNKQSTEKVKLLPFYYFSKHSVWFLMYVFSLRWRLVSLNLFVALLIFLLLCFKHLNWKESLYLTHIYTFFSPCIKGWFENHVNESCIVSNCHDSVHVIQRTMTYDVCIKMKRYFYDRWDFASLFKIIDCIFTSCTMNETSLGCFIALYRRGLDCRT